MKNLKSKSEFILENMKHILLCVKSTDPDFYWKFTKGKKYTIYLSKFGTRLKDDNNKFCCIDGWRDFNYLNTNVDVFEYADGIFTTDNTLEDYELRIQSEKYNL